MHKTVLIIDDSPTIRVVIEQQFHRLQFSTRSFADGIEALAWLTSSQVIPDFLLIDVNLPKLDGYEVVRALRLQPGYRTTAIALMSSGEIARDRLKGIGITYDLQKPFTMSALLSVARTALSHAQTSLASDPGEEGK